MAHTPPTPEDDEAFARRARRAVQGLADAPAALQRAAVDLWPAQGLPQRVAAALQRVVAVLSFDSWAATPALAMRSGAGATRQLVFDAPAGSVDLRIAPAAGTYTLAGQWLGEDGAGTVELADADGHPAASAPLDDAGAFHFDGLTEGAYRLTLSVSGTLIELPPLALGGSRR